MNFNQLWEFSTKGKNGSISSNIGPQVRRLLFTSTLHGSQRSYFPFERLFLPLICINSSFQPSVQTNWRISGFASAKVCLFWWIFCLIQPNWSFEEKKGCPLFSELRTTKFLWSHVPKASPMGFLDLMIFWILVAFHPYKNSLNVFSVGKEVKNNVQRIKKWWNNDCKFFLSIFS